jgi:biotin transport system permease protein
MLTSLDIDGDTWLHRMPVRSKLAALLVISLGLFLVERPLPLGIAAGLGAFVYVRLGMRPGEAFRRIRPVLFTIAILGLFNLIFLPAAEALASVLRLVALLLAAASVTATTTIAAFIDTLTALARPLERIGLLKAADVGLAFGLVMRFVPEIHMRYARLKEAHQARGVPVRLHRLLAPLIISVLKDADAIAEAIDARGIRGQ